MAFVRVSVSLPEEQKKWVDDNQINLSKLVQAAIEARTKTQKKK